MALARIRRYEQSSAQIDAHAPEPAAIRLGFRDYGLDIFHHDRRTSA
jgi:hypothetical protein